MSTKSSFLNILLFIPLIILTGILFSGNLIFSPFVLIGTIIIYLVGFMLLGSLSNIFTYFFFGILALFILLFNLDLSLSLGFTGKINEIKFIEFISMIITSFIFLFSSYYYSTKKDLTKLFSIGTIGTILILAPVISNSGDSMILFIIAIIIFCYS
ncbi:MAG: hypothetical protein Q9M97_09310 [Candidatus Gracilibacteria bacterium]|nr:hypothetical protein [Candidatus Gracilibacteria bacterium]